MAPIFAAALCTTRLRADDAKQIAALQHDAGRDGDLLIAAAHRSQVEAPRPILPRRIPEIPACKLRIHQEDIGGRDRHVEELLVLHLLGARSDQLDDDLARPGERDHVARLERRAGLCFDDAFSSAEPVDEQPVIGHTRLGSGDS